MPSCKDRASYTSHIEYVSPSSSVHLDSTSLISFFTSFLPIESNNLENYLKNPINLKLFNHFRHNFAVLEWLLQFAIGGAFQECKQATHSSKIWHYFHQLLLLPMDGSQTFLWFWKHHHRWDPMLLQFLCSCTSRALLPSHSHLLYEASHHVCSLLILVDQLLIQILHQCTRLILVQEVPPRPSQAPQEIHHTQ